MPSCAWDWHAGWRGVVRCCWMLLDLPSFVDNVDPSQQDSRCSNQGRSCSINVDGSWSAIFGAFLCQIDPTLFGKSPQNPSQSYFSILFSLLLCPNTIFSPSKSSRFYIILPEAHKTAVFFIWKIHENPLENQDGHLERPGLLGTWGPDHHPRRWKAQHVGGDQRPHAGGPEGYWKKAGELRSEKCRIWDEFG